jgi:VIT1/CCC1 family predicted Fe2+/Mn2+ transporter
VRDDSRPILHIAVGAVSVALILFASFSNHWIDGANATFLDMPIDAKVGLRSLTICDDLDCETVDHKEVLVEIEKSKEWVPPEEQAQNDIYSHYGRFVSVAAATFWIALATSAVALLCLILAFAGKKPYWPISPYSLALLLCAALLVMSTLTLALHPFKAAGWGTGYGFLIAGAGLLGTLFSMLMLGRTRPDDVEWLE